MVYVGRKPFGMTLVIYRPPCRRDSSHVLPLNRE